MRLLETYGFFEPEDTGKGSHCDYKNVSFLFKFGTVFRLEGLSSERFLWIKGRLVCLFVCIRDKAASGLGSQCLYLSTLCQL